MMTDWAQTERCSVRITLAEGLVIRGDIHLQPRVAWRDGPETPLELMNRDEAFFPVTLAGGDVAFVAKAQVASLALGVGVEEEPDPERRSAARTISLEVMMVGGAEHRGVAVHEMPPNRSRALDFLNEAQERFFLLVTAGGSLCLNRQYVRAVRPLS